MFSAVVASIYFAIFNDSYVIYSFITVVAFAALLITYLKSYDYKFSWVNELNWKFTDKQSDMIKSLLIDIDEQPNHKSYSFSVFTMIWYFGKNEFLIKVLADGTVIYRHGLFGAPNQDIVMNSKQTLVDSIRKYIK